MQDKVPNDDIPCLLMEVLGAIILIAMMVTAAWALYWALVYAETNRQNENQTTQHHAHK